MEKLLGYYASVVFHERIRGKKEYIHRFKCEMQDKKNYLHTCMNVRSSNSKRQKVKKATKPRRREKREKSTCL